MRESDELRIRWHHGENPPGGRIIPDHMAQPVAETIVATDPSRPFEWNADIISKFAHVPGEPLVKPRWRCGILFRLGSCWIGAHYAPHNKRLCINLVPFVTIWITAPGGRVP